VRAGAIVCAQPAVAVGPRPLKLDVRRRSQMSWQWHPQTPLEFLVFFVVMWVGVSLLLSKISGWSRLAEHYRLVGSFAGPKSYMCSAMFRRFVGYNNVLIVGFDQTGLYLAVWIPFRIGHPPLLIPWQAVRNGERSWFNLFSTPLELGSDPAVRVSMSSRLVRRIEEETGYSLGAPSNNRWSGP
jgi:hypothetical protein